MEAKDLTYSKGNEQMLTIKINGVETPLNTNGLSKMTDLVELIKASIDPAHIITGILLNGEELTENDWQRSISEMNSCLLDITTGEPEIYAAERLKTAGEIVNKCYAEFRASRKLFQAGDMKGGNSKLIEATHTLKAFFSWYGTLLDIVPEGKRSCFNITNEVTKLSEICKQICQQQLYQSWWALGETIQKDLEPQLDTLEDVCRKNFKESGYQSLVG